MTIMSAPTSARTFSRPSTNPFTTYTGLLQSGRVRVVAAEVHVNQERRLRSQYRADALETVSTGGSLTVCESEPVLHSHFSVIMK